MVCPIRAKRLVLLLGCGPPLRTSHNPSPGVMTWLQSGPAKPLEQIQLPKVCWFKYGYNHLDFSVMLINRIWRRISTPTRALPRSRESMRPWANASRREICKGSGIISTRPPVKLSPTCLKSSLRRRNARPAALIMRTSSQTKKKRAITRTNVSSGKKANKNLFLSKWGTSRYRHWGNILSKLANSVTCKSVLSSEKLKKRAKMIHSISVIEHPLFAGCYEILIVGFCKGRITKESGRLEGTKPSLLPTSD